MSGVLIVERIVLESLEKGEKCLKELARDTKLDINLVKNIISHLQMKRIVSFSRTKKFELNTAEKKNWLKEVNDKKHISLEVKELFSSLVNNYFREEVSSHSYLKMKKIWLTSKERYALEKKFDDIEQFLTQISCNRMMRPVKEVTADQQVLIWGASPYIDLVDEQLEAV